MNRPTGHGPTRSQQEHPLVRGDVQGHEDEGLRLLHLRAYVEAARLAEGKRVLDVGCNDGYGSVAMADSAASVLGIDLSHRAIAAARARPAVAGVTFQRVDEGRLPFADGSFEFVTAFQVIEHVEAVTPFLQELRRVAAPGAQVLFTTPNACVRGTVGRRTWNPFHVREYAPDELREELAAVFDQVTIRGLFGPAGVHASEATRAAAAVHRMDHPRPRPVRLVIDLVPESVRARALRLLRRPARAGAEDYRVEDFSYSTESLEDALDLQAICLA